EGYKNVIGTSSKDFDLRDFQATNDFFLSSSPEYVFFVAARVGGIKANMTYPAEFIFDNLQMQNNVIHTAMRHKVKKLMFFGSNCMYPRECEQPMREDSLLTGILEPTNQAYALAKLAGMEMCKAYRKQHGADFITVIPANLYGPQDTYNQERSHFIPALLERFDLARLNSSPNVVMWGTGTPRRDVLYVDDLAEACLLLMKDYSGERPINVGTGRDHSILEVAETIKDVVGFRGKILFDASKPDGMPRKMLDASRLQQLGWQAKTELRDGLALTYESFLKGKIRT
ncbi:MAG: GDP-L-fucose synthase, partial [Nanoarchaeota archaeon]